MTRLAATGLALVALAVAGCGGSETPAAQPPPTSPAPQPPPAAPVPVVTPLATGSFPSGVPWTLTWETVPGRRGALCVAFADAAGDVHECASSSRTWFVGTIRRGARRIVYAVLPCGVRRVELHGNGTVLDAADTVAADDAMLAVLEAPTSVALTLTARGHLGDELFALDSLADDPPVPAVGC